jgi:predicted permease
VALLPAWRLAAADASERLRAGRAAAGAGPATERVRTMLLAVQVTVAVTLLVVTGLVSASLLRVLAADRGFETDRVVSASVSFQSSNYASEASRIALFDRMLDAVQALPGVRAATVASMLPLGGEGQVNFLVTDRAPAARSERPSANYRFVGPDYFRTLGVALVRGRAFTLADRRPDRPIPAVVSAPVAARLWPGEDPIGRQFRRGIEGEIGFEVVGVAADARLTSLERVPPLMVYVPYWWGIGTRAFTSLLVRTDGGPETLAPDLRRAIAGVDPQIALDAVQPLEARVDAATALRRYQVQLVAGFGVFALAIATLGVYAVTSYAVSRRRREMNIRAALGARRGEVLALIVRQSSLPIALGLAAGMAAAVAGGGLVRSLLYEVDARDPAVLSSSAAVVAFVALGAAMLAARRGTSIDPAAALREE